jgi:AcrR family transcriptional regulator
MITTARPTSDTVPQPSNGDKALQIVMKAIELFNRVGYERVKISDITDALQMGKGTFYLYFKNKKELLLECFRQLDLVISSIEANPEVRNPGGFFDRLRPRIAAAHEHYISLAGTINLIRLSSESEDPQIRQCAHDAYRAIIDPLKKDLEVAIRHGLARNIDPELAICGLIGLAESIINRAACDDRYTIQQIDEMIIDFSERAFSAAQNHSYSQALPADRHVFAARITDRNGVCSDVSELQFDGSATLRGILGQAEIEVEPARVNSITIREANEGWFADVTTRDGVQASLQVQPNLIISGETPLGTLRIALSDTSTVDFSDPQR